MSSKFSQVLSVTRQAPELIVPARPRPREVKLLSDIDDQEGFRFHAPVIFFYKNSPSVKEKDPVSVIKEAISKALVFYYPFAGRLIEGPNRKLLVDCNGEGILFIEADADFTIEQLGDEIQPPCPFLEQLLYNVPGSEAILGSPLLLIQVTRLACGGFILALSFNHTMCDVFGLMQFLKAIEEMVRGAKEPSMLPIWQRELLTCTHHEYDGIDSTQGAVNPNDIAHKSFHFGSKEILALRNQLPIHLRNNCTNFELLTACIWKCRTTALELEPNEIVRVSCAVNLRNMKYNNQLPPGYYGNAVSLPVVSSKAELLSKYYSLGYAVELVKKLKDTKEYIRSLIDFRDIKENFFVSDFTRFGFKELDFGWGKPVFAGPAGAILFISFYIKLQSKDNGEYGTLVPICLPLKAMERFEEELKKITNYGPKL